MQSYKLAFLPFLLLVSGTCYAQTWVQLYGGVASSPFQEFGMLETLAVEDFEDGEVNIRGVNLLQPTGMQEGRIEITSTPTVSTANSVAEDTGDPNTGTLLLGTPTLCATSYPPLCPATASFEFDEPWPTFVGFVWTDAVRSTIPQSGLPFSVNSVTTGDGDLIVERVFDRPDYDPDNVTADDLFIGFTNDSGIRSLQFTVVTDEAGGYLAMDHLQIGFAALAGDADRDGTVNFNDFLVLSMNFGAEGGWAEGDFTHDGRVEFPDFLQLSANFGKQFEMPLATAPEPSFHTGILWWVIGCSFAVYRNPRCRR